jgi:haloacetate dehalogenase
VADALGHDRFALVGHDRGALVAFRAALDHPDRVSHLATIGVLPAADMWRSLRGQDGIFAFHLYLLAHPSDLPEQLVGAAPDLFFGHFLDQWARTPMPADVRAAYLAAARTPEAIRAMCADYRADAFADAQLDAADRAAGRTLTMPVTALWEDPGDTPLPFDPVRVWQAWAPDLVTAALPGGHFLPEDCPDEVAAAVRALLRRA